MMNWRSGAAAVFGNHLLASQGQSDVQSEMQT